MDQLLPIIRRVRRPLLIVADAPAVVVAKDTTTETPLPPVVPETVLPPEEPKVSDAKTTPKRSAR